LPNQVLWPDRDLPTMRDRLAHAQEMADLAVDAAELGTWSYEIDHDLQRWSDRTRALFGVAADAPITRETFWSAAHPDDRDAIRRAVEACTQAGTTFELDFRVCSADRGTRWMRVRGRAQFGAHGRPLRILGVMYDIDARVRAEAERLDLLQRLIRVQEDERAHLARELHDAFGQHLTALSIDLKRLEHALPRDGTPSLLGSLQSAVSQLSAEVHRIAWALRPMALDDFGLRQALTNIVGDWSARTGIACDVHWRETAGGRMSADVETAVYRAVQEALTNVSKHAHASQVSVVVERHGHTLQVIIEDDGVGLDPERALANPDRRLGLAGMRERLGLVGGSLTIESTRDVGTTLYMRVTLADTELAA
jgi:PAS domain S-box-containing protein